ncbi:MAG: hypothetical protein IMW99_08240, partial [Firmicutes bacterium]|nr:hypothetical protein [Bacillota bacterium]
MSRDDKATAVASHGGRPLKERLLQDILPRVSKPARYLGDEVHSVHKDPAKVAVRFALAFPDVYEVGMSHLGLKILYHILNQREDVWAERAFSPWTDMEAELRARGLPA